jgi:hypothetical protein
MTIDKKILEEIERYKDINKYTKRLLSEQLDPTDEPAPDQEQDNAVVDEPINGVDEPINGVDEPTDDQMGNDTLDDEELDGDNLEPIDDETEELDITDLVNMTQSIKNDIEDRKNESGDVAGKMDVVFSKLDDLEQKLSNMDQIISKILLVLKKRKKIKHTKKKT